ncbi:MAG: MATE family efflux transporter [Pirellulaceae bacterium]|jgi:putative MATE family efflux protein|nr:MATE family efflux transporter [Pirellulaceae bacterium]
MIPSHRAPDQAPAASMGHDLTSAPVPLLIRRLAIPASVGFLFNTLFNVVDTLWAGQYSTDALAALSLSFPIYFLMVAMGMGFSTGATALLGSALGAGERREAALIASQGRVLSLLVALVIMAVGYATVPALFRLLGASEDYLRTCLDYMFVILAGTPILLQVYMVNAVLNAQGDMASFRNYLMVATVANMVLDPWFLFGGFGLPAMGMKGIAAATIVVQICGLLYLLRRARSTGLLDRDEGARYRPDRRVLAAITGQGVPASLNMMTVALGIFVITYYLSQFGQAAVAAYGVATRIEQLVLLPTIGLNTAVLTLAAQNGGARLFERVRQAIHTALLYGAWITAGGLVVLYFGAENLMTLFTDDTTVVATGAHYLRIAAFIQYAYVILFVNTALLQGLRKPALALWIGLYRQLAAPCMFFYLATRIWDFGLDGIWAGVFMITWSAALVAVILARRVVAWVANETRHPDLRGG